MTRTRFSTATAASAPSGLGAMAFTASRWGTSVSGPAFGGGGAKPSTKAASGILQTLTPVPRTPTRTREPSGAAAMKVTVLGKPSVHRGMRAPSPGRRSTGMHAVDAMPAAPVVRVPRGRTKCDSSVSPASTTRTRAATVVPASAGPVPSSTPARAASGTSRRPSGRSSVTTPVVPSSATGRRQTSVTQTRTAPSGAATASRCRMPIIATTPPWCGVWSWMPGRALAAAPSATRLVTVRS